MCQTKRFQQNLNPGLMLLHPSCKATTFHIINHKHMQHLQMKVQNSFLGEKLAPWKIRQVSKGQRCNGSYWISYVEKERLHALAGEPVDREMWPESSDFHSLMHTLFPLVVCSSVHLFIQKHWVCTSTEMADILHIPGIYGGKWLGFQKAYPGESQKLRNWQQRANIS